MKVQEAVKKIVEGNPLYGVVLSSGLANLSAVARSIKPLVDAAVGRETKIVTIVKSLERLRGKGVATAEIFEHLGEMSVAAYSGFSVAERPPGDLNALVASGEPFVAVSDGRRVRVLAPSRLLGGGGDKGLIRITMPKAPVGIVTFIVQLMRSVGLAPEHIIRYNNEVYIVLDRGDVPKAMELLESFKKLIERSTRDLR